MKYSCFLALVSSLLPSAVLGASVFHRPSASHCVIPFGADDDTPAIVSAFKECNNGGTVVFQNETYNIGTILQTWGLHDINVELHGTLLWSTNISYWINNSFPLGYQNQSVAWSIGGDHIRFDGFGYGTFNGNGDVWYAYANGASNLPGRPINLVINETTNSVFQNLRLVQSQFWTMAVIRSENVFLDNFYISSQSNGSGATQNTDGADTFYSNNITFSRFSITNGDDSISLKANSSNIIIKDSFFYGGGGVALGSIGQYSGAYEFLENITATNVTCVRTGFAAYLKTWTGVEQGVPPNGGGGGLGYGKNIVFSDFTLVNVSEPAYITQCTSYDGATGGCDTSLFQVSNITWGPFTGTVSGSVLASFQCSADAPCSDIRLVDFDQIKNTTALSSNPYRCNNTESVEGFTCTGHV